MSFNNKNFYVALLSLSLFYLSSLSVSAQELEPLTLGYQGHITNLNGDDIQESYDITFRIYNAPIDGEEVWSEVIQSVRVRAGYFQVNLGLTESLPITESPDTPLFMSIQVAGDVELTPRLRLGGAIRAQWAERAIQADVAQVADHATDVRDEEIHPATVSIGEREVIDAEGRWVGEPIEGTGGASADPAEVATQLASDPNFQNNVAETLATEQADLLRGQQGVQGEL